MSPCCWVFWLSSNFRHLLLRCQRKKRGGGCDMEKQQQRWFTKQKGLCLWAVTTFGIVLLSGLMLLLLCEYFIYYIALQAECDWPTTSPESTNEDGKPLKVLFFADTHLLGRKRGHWLDRLKREWQMERSFQTIVELFNPDTAILLGDTFDEGKNDEWAATVARLKKMFRHSDDMSVHYIVGNHDVGFHQSLTTSLIDRYEAEFGQSNRLFSIEGRPFVALNSMTFKKGCKCRYCLRARDQLTVINSTLPDFEGISPILLLHFPLFRPNEHLCSQSDVNPALLRRFEVDGTELVDGVYNHTNKADYEVVNEVDSEHILSVLRPKLVLSGHTHYSCHYVHPTHNVTEITVSTFNWRNRDDPSFVLALIGKDNETSMRRCYLPSESTVITIYCVGAVFITVQVSVLCFFCPNQRWRRTKPTQCIPCKTKTV